MKTLDQPLLAQLLDPIVQILTPDLAKKLAALRFDGKTESKIDWLARKCNRGKPTVEVLRESGTYVQTVDDIAILRAKARAIAKANRAKAR